MMPPKNMSNTSEGTPEGTSDKAGEEDMVCKTPHYEAMNNTNKRALKVMVEEGVDAAVKHMFTDQKTGRALSYAEMRLCYG
jgi:hypothetical protein